MMLFPEQMGELSGRVVICGTFDFSPPVRKGSVECWLSTTKGGEAASPALFRTLKVEEGKFSAPRFYKQDIDAVLPSSRRLWLVVAYGPKVMMTSAVRIP